MVANLNVAGALRAALIDAFEADGSAVLLGEEVAHGGLFGTSEGLAERFGDRVISYAGCEATMVGAALGMAQAGLRPVVELLLADHALAAMQQLGGELANQRYATAGEFSARVVLRMPVGRGSAGGPRQSLSPEALLSAIPGLVVLTPSNPADAYGLLRAALEQDDPVVICEPKSLYGGPAAAVDRAAVPIGRARVARSGRDLTLVSWGAAVPRAIEAAELAASEDGVEASVIDLRSLAPLDEQTLLEAVAETGRAIVYHEGPRRAGFGAEVAATIAEGALEVLQAPVLRLAAADTPASCAGERHQAPGVAHVRDAILETACWA